MRHRRPRPSRAERGGRDASKALIVKNDRTDEHGALMAHDQITEAEARERGLLAESVCLGDECDGIASWWHEGERVFWLAPALCGVCHATAPGICTTCARTDVRGDPSVCQTCNVDSDGTRIWMPGEGAPGCPTCHGSGAGQGAVDAMPSRCCCSPGVTQAECPEHGGAI